MIKTIDMVVRGDSRVFSYYQKAEERWQSIMARDGARDPDKLAKILTDEQVLFEDDCDGNRSAAQEIIAVVGIVRLYDLAGGFDGHMGNVRLVRLAIARSHCSSEVKFMAEIVAERYGLQPLTKGE